MSKSTISTFQLFALIPDAETARLYLEARLWPQGPRCPVCRSCERITARTRGFYRCNACKEDFTVRLNEGNVARHTLDRLDSFIVNVVGKRLTYKALIARASS